MTDNSDWMINSGAIAFMKQVLSNHTAVATYKHSNRIQFDVVRRRARSNLRVVLVDEYELGEAFAYAIIEEFDGVDVIVNNGNWNHIILDWRDFAKRTGVVVLKIADFMGAINYERLTQYVTQRERDERREKRRKSS